MRKAEKLFYYEQVFLFSLITISTNLIVMEKQDYENHTKYYYPHHFIFYPLILVLTAASVRQGLQHSERSLEWFAIAMVFVLLGWLSFMLRQHYSLTNQHRIVRLELRLRYYQLTQKRLE